jgi:hypothetical protein
MKLEGSEVLEKLAEVGKVDEFYDAVDKDDFHAVEGILQFAGVDEDTIAWVLNEMSDGDGE